MGVQQINQDMMGQLGGRIDELGGLENSINGQLADPIGSQYYGAQLNDALGSVKEAQGVLNQEMQLRQNLDAAYKNSTFKNPDQDPAVKEAQEKLNEHRKKNEKYYKKGKVGDPCVSCIKKKTQFRFPPDIIKAAQDSQRETGVPASITLAQWALESGWGKKMPAGSNNPFGIKAVGNQPGVDAVTKEDYGHGKVTVTQRFRKFDSLSDAFKEHARLLSEGKYLKQVMEFKDDPDKMADALTGTYATDTEYGSLLKGIMKSNNLYQYNTLPAQ
ncbi:MAG: glucosaminidase domain-containing protein [Polyangiaceae bacterium]|nr:glucosaminidase domain-containing protein [Polyangiaceae bacterium]